MVCGYCIELIELAMLKGSVLQQQHLVQAAVKRIAGHIDCMNNATKCSTPVAANTLSEGLL
jgi:hypothetical protein